MLVAIAPLTVLTLPYHVIRAISVALPLLLSVSLAIHAFTYIWLVVVFSLGATINCPDLADLHFLVQSPAVRVHWCWGVGFGGLIGSLGLCWGGWCALPGAAGNRAGAARVSPSTASTLASCTLAGVLGSAADRAAGMV
jgi:hypothetical protein